MSKYALIALLTTLFGGLLGMDQPQSDKYVDLNDKQAVSALWEQIKREELIRLDNELLCRRRSSKADERWQRYKSGVIAYYVKKKQIDEELACFRLAIDMNDFTMTTNWGDFAASTYPFFIGKQYVIAVPRTMVISIQEWNKNSIAKLLKRRQSHKDSRKLLNTQRRYTKMGEKNKSVLRCQHSEQTKKEIKE
jgi:hypothetical protein